MKYCPHCGGTTGYQSRATFYGQKRRHWNHDEQDTVMQAKPIKVSRRRYCQDCGKAVGAALDMPTFKL